MIHYQNVDSRKKMYPESLSPIRANIKILILHTEYKIVE